MTQKNTQLNKPEKINITNTINTS